MVNMEVLPYTLNMSPEPPRLNYRIVQTNVWHKLLFTPAHLGPPPAEVTDHLTSDLHPLGSTCCSCGFKI